MVFNLLAKDKVSPELARLRHSFSAFGGHLKGIALAAAGIFGGIQVAGFLKDAVAEYRDAAKIGRLTNQVIQSTAGVAGVTAEHVGELATKLQNVAGIDDDVIIGGENLLLTMTKVRNGMGKGNDIFDRTTAAALDMSVALGRDLRGSILLVGRALQDPVKGANALRRAQVILTDQQKKSIKTFMDQGNLMGAQKIILGALEQKFKGAAAAAVDPVQKASVAWGNLKEAIGDLVFPAVAAFANLMLNKVVPAVKNGVAIVKELTGWFNLGFVDGVQTADGAAGLFERLGMAARTLGHWFSTEALPRIREFATYLQAKVIPVIRDLIIRGFHGAQEAGQKLRQLFIEHRAELTQLGQAFKTVAMFIVDKVLPVLGPLFTNNIRTGISMISAMIRQIAFWINVFNRIKLVVTTVVGGVISKIDALVGFFKKLPGRIASATSGLWNGLVSSFKAAVNRIIGMWNNFHLTLGGGSFLGVDIPSVTLNTPDIPYLDKGGTIKQTGIAVVHEGERVIPARERPVGGRPILINGSSVLQQLVDEISRELRQRGLTLAVVGRGGT